MAVVEGSKYIPDLCYLPLQGGFLESSLALLQGGLRAGSDAQQMSVVVK